MTQAPAAPKTTNNTDPAFQPMRPRPLGGAQGVWLGNKAWPNNRSCGQFAKDVFRISGAKTDREKALAFYDWYIRCMHRGPNLYLDDGSGCYGRHLDPLVLFTSWGHHECTGWGWIGDECLNGAGLRARRVVVHNQGHTYHEVFYKGKDGRETWHAFDPFCGWYFLNEHGEVASCEELAANPQLVQNPFPGHAEPLGHHPDRTNLGHRHRVEDQLYIEQPHRFDALNWNLQRGQEVTFYWMPEAPHLALFGSHDRTPDQIAPRVGERNKPVTTGPVGAHCSIPEIGRHGGILHPEHMPYWKNYMWETARRDRHNHGQPSRYHGSGALRWKPLQYGVEAAEYAIQAKFENGCLKPAARHAFTEVWYHFKLPFLISNLSIDYDIVGKGGDYCGFSISGDDRRTIWPLKMNHRGPGWGMVTNGQANWCAGHHSVQGMREFWLRVDMASHHENPTLALQAMDVVVNFQHNMNIQPRLLPGENPLWLEAGKVESNAKLEAEWIYQVKGKEQRSLVKLDKAGKAESNVSIDADCPSEVFMTGLKLRCR